MRLFVAVIHTLYLILAALQLLPCKHTKCTSIKIMGDGFERRTVIEFECDQTKVNSVEFLQMIDPVFGGIFGPIKLEMLAIKTTIMMLKH